MLMIWIYILNIFLDAMLVEAEIEKSRPFAALAWFVVAICWAIMLTQSIVVWR